MMHQKFILNPNVHWDETTITCLQVRKLVITTVEFQKGLFYQGDFFKTNYQMVQSIGQVTCVLS
jgi:hypothetical protein